MGTTAEKLTYLNGTKRLLRRRLNSLGADITLETRFRDYLLWLDRFYNAASSSVDFEILGETTLKAVNTSTNLLYIPDGEIVTDGVTVTISNGKITINGTAERDVYIKITNGIQAIYEDPSSNDGHTYYDTYGWLKEKIQEFDPATTVYKQYCHGTGDAVVNEGTSTVVQITTGTNNMPVFHREGFSNLRNRTNIYDDKDVIGTATCANTKELNCVYLELKQGVQLNQYFWLQVCLTQESTWTPNYDAAPASPDNPKEIINKSGEITYTASDGTEFPISLGTGNMLKLKDGTYTDNGITAVVSNNEITLNGTVSNKTSSIEIPSNLETLSGDYTLSLHDISGTYTGYDSRASNFSYFRVQSKSNNSKYMSVEVSLNNGSYSHDDFSNEEVKVVMKTSPSYGTITFTDYKFKPQVLKGWYKTEPPYIPYSSIELCKIGDYKDRIYYKNGKFYCERKIKGVTLNGSEFWGYTGGNSVFYTTSITDYALNNNIPYSTYYNGITNVNGAGGMVAPPNNTIAFINVSGQTTPRFYIKDTRYTNNTNDLKTWLSTHPTVVYYVLDEPVITEITKENGYELYDQLKAIIDHETKLEIEKKIF